ncbi:tetratricopeptide repeat protein [Desulfatibacillum aliphaticivorans]|uniref:tetratricopeptide repeat protein n=1 Tax=Desulfatibacillum aliphaticivorans TaxID=218208 RepID=UPI00040160D7|nr:tetratricopeptide repeat protein [Desulfatibacillum aliphaticivorans]
MARPHNHDFSKAPHGAFFSTRLLAAVAVLVVFVGGTYILGHKLTAQVYFEKAKNQTKAGHYGLALQAIEKAYHHDPHNAKILAAYGNACLDASFATISIKPKQERAALALSVFETAVEENPLDAACWFGLGRAQALVEELHPEKGKSCSYLDSFRKTVSLRPNGITYNMHLARCLAYCGQDQELSQVVKHIARIYPPSVYHLTKENYWTPELEPQIKAGLAEAIDQSILPRQAHQAMASLFEREGDYAQAINYYKQSLNYLSFENTGWNYIHLGSLMLKNNQPEKASEEFLYGLSRSEYLEKDVERIFHIYRREKQLAFFAAFYKKVVEDFFVSSRLKILIGRAYFEQEDLEDAQGIFEEAAYKEENAEAFYWLARIADKNKDWPAMELSIQKATVLEPDNSRYHLLFSQVLSRLKKYERSEKQASLAISTVDKPSPWLHNHRAYVLWRLGDYKNALEDWRKAIELMPERASFYAQAGRSAEKLGLQDLAREYFQKSLQLEPNNPTYQKLADGAP